MLIRIPKGWEIPESEVAPEEAFLNRRRFIQAAGLASIAPPALLAAAPYPAKRNPDFASTPGRDIAPEPVATGYNNFYEFHGTDKKAVKDLVGKFQTRPWTIEVGGLVRNPKTFNIDDIEKEFPLEERVYRFRCVERWAMSVPWTGFPMSALVKAVDPKPEAKYIRFVSVLRKDQMPLVQSAHYPFPYYEALRLDEAMNPLALFVTGLYGKPLPKQNGAPFRVIVPWKYGYKSPKSIVKIEFTAKQPHTFWNDVVADEYGFYSNVNPKRPHPRWSQANDMVIPTGEVQPTQMYNGYGKWVAGLYKGNEF